MCACGGSGKRRRPTDRRQTAASQKRNRGPNPDRAIDRPDVRSPADVLQHRPRPGVCAWRGIEPVLTSFSHWQCLLLVFKVDNPRDELAGQGQFQVGFGKLYGNGETALLSRCA